MSALEIFGEIYDVSHYFTLLIANAYFVMDGYHTLLYPTYNYPLPKMNRESEALFGGSMAKNGVDLQHCLKMVHKIIL